MCINSPHLCMISLFPFYKLLILPFTSFCHVWKEGTTRQFDFCWSYRISDEHKTQEDTRKVLCCHEESFCFTSSFLNTRPTDSQNFPMLQQFSKCSTNQQTSWYDVTHCLDQVHLHEAWVTPQHTSEPPPPTPQKRVYIPVQCDTPAALKPHECFLFSMQPLYVSFMRVLPEQDGSLGLGKKRRHSCQKWSVVEKQWHTLCDSHCSLNPVLLAVIPCSFYLSDHGCLLQLVVSALAPEHWDNLTNMVVPLAKGTEKKGENERNALIAARI